MSLAINLTAITGTALMLMTSGAISAPRFTFQDAEFFPNQREGLLAAKSFVSAELTTGLPMDEAIARVERASSLRTVRLIFRRRHV